ncbi:MAG: hypothetical protein EBZ48_09955 [Proteobacteria bacterium]|nr:hypothetical protein [Pseudomonadota bacterium]
MDPINHRSPRPPASAQPNGRAMRAGSDQPLELDLSDCRDLLPAMRRLFQTYSAEEIGRYARFEQGVPDGRNYFLPACIGEYEALKVIHSRPANTPLGIERSQSTILISDRASGRHLITLNGVAVTPAKSALTTMVGLRHWLAAVQPESLRVGVFGGGSVARGHIAQLYQLFPEQIAQVLVHSPRQSAAQMVQEISARHPCRVATAAELLSESNVIIAATTARPGEPPVRLGSSVDLSVPRFFAGIGFHDVDPALFARAQMIFSEDPLSYRRSQLPLAQFLHANVVVRLVALSELERGECCVPTHGLTLSMQYGTAMTDLAVCLSKLGIDPHRAASF